MGLLFPTFKASAILLFAFLLSVLPLQSSQPLFPDNTQCSKELVKLWKPGEFCNRVANIHDIAAARRRETEIQLIKNTKLKGSRSNLFFERDKVLAKISAIKKKNSNKSSMPDIESYNQDLLSYSFGNYAHMGILFGRLKYRGTGLVASWRFSGNSFASVSSTHISNGSIANTDYKWEYSGNSYYSYESYCLGFSARMYGSLGELSGYFVPTFGLGRYRYIYEYTKSTNNNIVGSSKIIDADRSGYNLVIAPVFLFNFKLINIHVGAELGLPNIYQSSFVSGLGFTF